MAAMETAAILDLSLKPGYQIWSLNIFLIINGNKLPYEQLDLEFLKILKFKYVKMQFSGKCA